MNQTLFDPLRKKHVALTEEERVRQFFIKWLNEERGYPLTLMASEYTINFNRRKFRCDIVAFDKGLKPLLIVECKAPHITLNQSTIEQIQTYNMILKVPHLVITNGNTTYVCSFNGESGRYEFVEDIPYFSQQ